MMHDIFISYSHFDNIATLEESGWVDNFHFVLNRYLGAYLGRYPKIWRDNTKMHGGPDFTEAVFENLIESRIYIPILSPSYLNSHLCLKELETFYKKNEEESKIFPVVKLPIKNTPSPIGNYLRYHFFTYDGTGYIRSIDPSLGQDSKEEFFKVVSDLAMNLSKVLSNFEMESQEREKTKPFDLPDDSSAIPEDEIFEIVFSFAGENREYVRSVANFLKENKIKVFYDEHFEATLWGKNLTEYLAQIYKGNARYCVMFISKHYAEKMWTKHESRSILEKELAENGDYILPVRFDNTEIPGLPNTKSYIDLTNKSPAELGNLIMVKLGKL